MARYPGAIWKPITAGKGRQRLTVYNRMNLHVAVSEGSSLHSYFNKPGIPDSHFYVRRDGTVEQYVDTSMRAFADLDGNDATISVETQGMGGGKWTPQQVESLARLYAWAVKTHGLARKMATSSKPGESSKGLSWHRLGIDGNFPSLPNIRAGRGQRGGGMHYSTSAGKECPGDERIPQIPGIFDRAMAILGGANTTQEDDMSAAAERQIDELHAKLLRKFTDGDQQVDIVDGVRRDLIIDRRIEADVNTLVASNRAQSAAIETLAKSVGVDPAVITKTVATAVDKALADVELTLTPKES